MLFARKNTSLRRIYLTLLTGLLRVLWLLSRTKDNVDHAGHSQPLDQWKALITSKWTTCFLSLNSSSSIVQAAPVTTDAMVDLWTSLSLTLKATVSKSKPTTLTLLRTEHANKTPTRELLVSRVTLMFLALKHKCRLLSASNQFPLELMLVASCPTQAECWCLTSAHSNWIMVSLLWDTLNPARLTELFTRSRTHGDQNGENQDMSVWLRETPLVCSTLPRTPLSENSSYQASLKFSKN